MGILLLIIGTLGWHIGMYGMFKKAGLDATKALIPFYNTWLIVEKCGISKKWFWLQLIPIAGQFITIWITIIWVMHFKKFSLIDHTLASIFPFIYFPYIGFSNDVSWGGSAVVENYQKSPSREWIDAGVFAIVAATIIRTFAFEAYVIPTESMEKTLLVNDFLFVSKMSYGPRVPATPVAFPFVHNTMPLSQTTPSYIKQIQLPYKRLPGFTTVKRNDVVVFNFPAGDTIINLPDFGSAKPYYDVLRVNFNGNRDALFAEYPILVHPYDKTDNYIKRCTAVSGDVVQLKNSVLYINGQPAFVPASSQTEYLVETNGVSFTPEFLKNSLGIDVDDTKGQIEMAGNGSNLYKINMTADEAAIIKKQPNVKSVQFYEENFQGITFPQDTVHYKWTPDNFGPLQIPAAGQAISLTPANIALYRRLITVYEGHTLTETNGGFLIDDKPATSFTPKYNYYWMMGDNRHRSQDSRFWGFVPETHIVGKASLIWFSWKNGPRFKRIFSAIK